LKQMIRIIFFNDYTSPPARGRGLKHVKSPVVRADRSRPPRGGVD